MVFPIQTKAYQIDHIKDSVFNIHFFDGELSLPEYLSAISILHEYMETHDDVYILSTRGNHFYFSKEAWEYIKTEFSQFSVITAEAIVIKQLHLRLFAKFYMKLIRNINLTQIFSTKENGLDWLIKQSENSNMYQESFKKCANQ